MNKQPFERILGFYRFECGGTVRILINGDVDTLKAIEMAEIIIGLKREEIAMMKSGEHPLAGSDGVHAREGITEKRRSRYAVPALSLEGGLCDAEIPTVTPCSMSYIVLENGIVNNPVAQTIA